MTRLALLAAASIALVATLAAPASATPDPWGANRACAVISRDDVRCYRSEAAMERATTQAALGESSRASTLAAYCNGRGDLWVYLYEDAGFGGRVLKFRDPGYWQNLSSWAFDNMTSSWRNTTGCTAWAATDANGAGSWLTLSANGSSSYVGASWDDVVSSLFLTS